MIVASSLKWLNPVQYDDLLKVVARNFLIFPIHLQSHHTVAENNFKVFVGYNNMHCCSACCLKDPSCFKGHLHYQIYQFPFEPGGMTHPYPSLPFSNPNRFHHWDQHLPKKNCVGYLFMFFFQPSLLVMFNSRTFGFPRIGCFWLCLKTRLLWRFQKPPEKPRWKASFVVRPKRRPRPGVSCCYHLQVLMSWWVDFWKTCLQ